MYLIFVKYFEFNNLKYSVYLAKTHIILVYLATYNAVLIW